MLILILTASLAMAATPAPRAKSIEILQAACRRSEVHAKADKRRVVCKCLTDKINANPSITDADFEYLARTWTDPGKKIEPAPEGADILEDFDADLTDGCLREADKKAKPKG